MRTAAKSQGQQQTQKAGQKTGLFVFQNMPAAACSGPVRRDAG